MIWYRKLRRKWQAWRTRKVVTTVDILVDTTLYEAIAQGEKRHKEWEQRLRPKGWWGRLKWTLAGKCVRINLVLSPVEYAEDIVLPSYVTLDPRPQPTKEVDGG